MDSYHTLVVLVVADAVVDRQYKPVVVDWHRDCMAGIGYHNTDRKDCHMGSHLVVVATEGTAFVVAVVLVDADREVAVAAAVLEALVELLEAVVVVAVVAEELAVVDQAVAWAVTVVAVVEANPLAAVAATMAALDEVAPAAAAAAVVVLAKSLVAAEESAAVAVAAAFGIAEEVVAVVGLREVVVDPANPEFSTRRLVLHHSKTPPSSRQDLERP
jgi:hypothetical protein